MEGKISLRQLKILLFFDVLAGSVITLPRIAAEYAGSDGWILIPGAMLFALSYVFMLNALAMRFPNETFAEYSRKLAGPLGTLLSVVLAGKLAFTAGFELKTFTEALRQTLLRSTPTSAIIVVMLALSAYLAQKGVLTLVRIAETFFLIVLVPSVIIYSAAYVNADFTNFLPVMKTPPQLLLTGSFYVSFAFRGLELALLVYPLVQRPEKVRRAQASAVVLAGAFMLLVTCAALLKFGENDVKAQLWPAIQVLDTLKVAGRRFLERQDGIIFSFWLISTFITIGGRLFFSAFTLRRLSGKKNGTLSLATAAALAAALFPGSAADVHDRLVFLDVTVGAAFMFVIPFMFIQLAWFRKIEGGAYERSDS